MHISEAITIRRTWTLRKYQDDLAYARRDAYAVSRFDGNILLEEGITEALNLIGGIAATAFDNANASIGVGDDATAEDAGQTGLQAGANKLYKGMEAGYPQVTDQTITWQAVFGSSEANFAWNEFTVANGGSDAADNLNRKVSAQGTKTSGQTWTIDFDITLS